MRTGGWFKESHRHSLAAHGIKTSFVANSQKGWRSRPQDLKWDESKGKYVDWRKAAAAKGISTGNKRRTLKGDTPEVPYGINVHEGEATAGEFAQYQGIPTQIALPIVPDVVQTYSGGMEIAQGGSLPPESMPLPRLPMEYRPTPVPLSQANIVSEQQAQPVEGGLPSMEVSPPLSIPGANIGGSVLGQPKKKPVMSASFLPTTEELDTLIDSSPKLTMAGKRLNFWIEGPGMLGRKENSLDILEREARSKRFREFRDARLARELRDSIRDQVAPDVDSLLEGKEKQLSLDLWDEKKKSDFLEMMKNDPQFIRLVEERARDPEFRKTSKQMLKWGDDFDVKLGEATE